MKVILFLLCGHNCGLEFHNDYIDFEVIKGYERTFSEFCFTPKITEHKAIIGNQIFTKNRIVFDLFGYEIGRFSRYNVDISKIKYTITTNLDYNKISDKKWEIFLNNKNCGYFKIEFDFGIYWKFSKNDNFILEYTIFKD